MVVCSCIKKKNTSSSGEVLSNHNENYKFIYIKNKIQHMSHYKPECFPVDKSNKHINMFIKLKTFEKFLTKNLISKKDGTFLGLH